MAASSPELLAMDDHGNIPTTTISTIAVQSGNTRIVIALLQSKEWIQLKIQEMHPAMTEIGTNLREATDLYQQHEKVLEKLQTKQSPVEELLRQADDLISNQKPRGEVYSAMAENLGLAWKDLNAQLEQRRHILEQAVAFFSKSELFADSLELIKKSISETFLPNTVEATTTMLIRHKEERKTALSNSMRMMSEGQLLLEKLCEVAIHSMGDSRPAHMQHAARQASAFVERHMENLQDKWRHLESLWNQKKTQLEQCLLKCQMENQMKEAETWNRTKGSDYLMQKNLGDSLANSEILHHEHQKIENECKEKQEHCLKLVKSAEDLSRKGNYAGEELKSRAYHILSECTDLTAAMEQRRQLLADSVHFFNKAQTALTKLDQIEIQLTTSETPTLSSTVEEIANSAIQDGRQILNTTGITEPGAQGIVRKIEELETKKKKLSDVCKAKESAASEKSLAFKKFCEKYDELVAWLSNYALFFIQRTRDMGTTQTAAKTFVEQHEATQNDLRMKTMEVEALLRTVPNLVRSGGEEAEVVHSKSENIKQQFSQLRTTLDNRILIGQRYLAFLKLSSKVAKEMDEFESLIKQAIEVPNQTTFRNIEEKQISLRQEILQLNNNGRNFLEDAKKVDDMYLNMSQPCATVEDILSRLELRNVTLTTQWLNFQNEISATKETLSQWESLIKESNKVIKSAQDLEARMFPVIPRELTRADSILSFLENGMSVLMPQIKTVQKEMDTFLKKAQTLAPLEDTHREGKQTMEKLKAVHQGFQKKLTDYQILVSMMTAFFKNFDELEKLIEMQESQYRITVLPNDVAKMEILIHDHEANKPTVLELFKFSNTEAQTLINKINEAEPPEAAASDREKICTVHGARKEAFERAWEDHKNTLEQHNQLCIFNRDMHLINQQIEALNNQLASIRQSYGESLPSAIHTSEAFLQFEKTIELLQIRIYEFISTAEKMILDQRVDSSRVNQEIQIMQKRWSTFRTEVTTNRKLIDVAIEYYKTIEEAEEWLKEGSRLLISVARKSSTCTKESDADYLKSEVQHFLDQGRSQQDERLRKISSLSMQLFGTQAHAPTEVIAGKNRDMMESFSSINTELTTLTTNIRITHQAKIVEQKGKEEMDAVLHAAQAEAEAAKAAAAAAQEAAKLAEAAAKAIPPKAPEPPQRPPRFVRQLTDAEINEGTKFTFECEVDGYPTPQVQWFKDGILVENNPDYQTSMENGICRLTIEETFSEDTAKFICKATNPAGVAETQSQLVVKEAHAQNELIPPHFVQEPLDSTVAEGEPHKLECQVFGNPLPLVSWFKDDVCIDYSTEYSITYNNGFCTLKMDEAHTDHQGRYTCRAVNQVGQVACSANLLVSSSLPFERPTIVVPLSNVMARAGQKLRLECSISGQPEPQITWLHNSKSLKETRDSKIHFDGRNATLVITEAFPKDAGTYTIIARNKAGEAVSSCNVSVKGRLPMETSDSEIASDIEPAKPQVKQQLVDQTVLEGNKVRMDCVIVGQPEPEVIWYHNGKPVKESDDFQLLFEGDRCTLIIKTAYLEDGGTYKCVAINSGGEASSVCQLKVEPVTEIVQKSEFSQKDILISVEKIEPPKFLKLLESSSVTEGQEVILECKVVAEPKATLSWYKDGKPIYTSQQYQIQSDDSGLSQLRIPCAQIHDRGTYSIRAQNNGGEAQSFCTVVVSPPVNFVQSQSQIPPTFLQHVENQNVLPGSTARFETLVEGTPTPQVRWNFQGKPVPKDQNHIIGYDGNKHWLIIQSTEKPNSGRYSAIAENDAGIATTSALLTVEERSLQTTDSTCFEQTAQSMVMTKKKTMVQSSFISSVSEVSDVDFQPPEFPSFSSLQSQQLVKMEQSSFTSAPLPMQFPQPVQPPPPVEPLPPPTVPPKFIRPVAATIVTEGEKVVLEAQYEGVPEPTIQWFKDDIELKNRPGLTISASGGGRTSVFIMKSVESDGGRYMCVASNSAGKANSVAEVRVKVRPPPTVPPKFIRPVSTAAVMEGEKILLEAQYEGLPEPTIQWFKEDIELMNRPGLTISKPGGGRTSIYILTSAESDSGRYTCVASNSAGRANSTADVRVKPRPPPTVPPKFTIPVSTAAVTEGEMILLEAQCEGLPEPTIQWYKDNVELRNRPGLTISMLGGGRSSVNILNSAVSDSGRYTCVALNTAGRANSTADVMVLPLPPPSVPPTFIRQVSTAAVTEGEQILLEAQYEGLPEPSIQWFKDDIELRSRPGLTISIPGGGKTSIYIPKSMESDCGRYTCVALNISGRANSTADVRVMPRPPPSVPPKFLIPVSTATVTEGEKILLEAQYEGLPEPMIQWYKNDVELRNRPGLTISAPGGGRTSVYIMKGFESDSGRYTCIISNNAGRANSTADVRVMSRPPPSVPPKFIIPVSTAAVTEGEKILLETHYEGLPEPTVQWFKNDIELRSRPGLTISTPGNGRTSACVLQSVESDSGRYTCVITNSAGRANSSADVSVMPRPPPSVPPKFIRPVTTAAVTEGEKILLEAQYEGLPEPTIQWFKDDIQLINRPGLTISTPGGGRTSIYIMKSVENDTGRYACVASNTAGRANSIAEVRVKPLSVPPKFITQVPTASVTAGENVLLEAQYEGLPEPAIKWFKDDMELRSRPGLTISAPGGGRTSVYILKSVESDSGQYTCIASNNAGRANSTAEVRVKAPSVPPKVIRPVPSAAVTEGDKILLEAQFEGLPEPTIQWFKDGIELRNRPGLTISTPAGGRTSLYIINSVESDSGQYTCTASNNAGKANSIAEVRVKMRPPPSVPPKFIRPVSTASVTEGEKILLEAQYEGFPEPTIQWFKDDFELVNRPGLTISNPGGGRTSVYILRGVESDSGRYACVASNNAGRANSIAEVRVKVPSVPPKFIRLVPAAAVTEGDKILLEAQFEGLPEPTIQWFKDGIELRNRPGLTISTPAAGRTSLYIINSVESDSGQYTCTASNNAGKANSIAEVRVKMRPPPSVPPKFIRPVPAASVTEGEKIQLEAQYEGFPEPTIQWFKDDLELVNRPGLTISKPGGGRTSVYILKSIESDSGRYTCVASNNAGRANSIAEVRVKLPSVPPKFIRPVPTASVTESEKILLEAQYEGFPEPTIQWFKDDLELVNRPGLTISNPGGGRTSLYILKSIESDSGQYTCVASNNAGRANSIAEVRVKPASVPPKFIRPVSTASVTEGEKILLEAQYEGFPEPTIQWFKDDLELVNRPGLTISKPGAGRTSVYILKSIESDSGRYTCVASNDAGRANSIAEVRVKSPSVPPKFVRPVSTASVTEGEKILLEAQYEGFPEPTIQWFKDDLELVNRPGLTVSNQGGGRTTVYILKSVESDSGRYTCVASNNAGRANSIAEVRVKSLSVPPKFIRPVPAALVTEGEQLSLEAQFEGLPQPSIQWFKDDLELKTRPGLTISTTGGFRTSLFIPKTVVNDSGRYSCVAMNNAGRAISNAEVKVKPPVKIEPPAPPSVPPKFIRPVSTAIVSEGEKLLLEAQYEGSPEPNIQWLKDDVELRNKPGLTISTPGGGRTSIYIVKSLENDGGRYSCIASNNAGKATSIAEVKVKPYRESPKFKKKLEAAVVKSGSKLTLQVEVTGVPKPEMKWYRNGNLLQDSPDCRISSSDNTHTVLINEVFPDDSGSYMAVASNVAGEARSIADLIVEEEKSPEEEKSVTYQEFSTIQQKKEVFTKISMNQAPSLEPYALPAEIPKAIEPPAPVKVPSPPPIPAVETKVWIQSKPEPFPAPAITEAPEPIPIPPEPLEMPVPPEPVKEIMPVVEFPTESVPIQTMSVEQTKCFQTSVPDEQLRSFPSSAPVTAAMSESFVKKSIMKFSHPDAQQQTRAEEKKTIVSSKTSTQQPLIQNGFDVDSKTTMESFSSMKQSSFISESKIVSTSESVSKSKPSQVPVPTKFVPKPVAPPVQKEKEKPAQSLVPVWKAKKESEPKPTWKKVQAPQEIASTLTQKTVESKFSSTGIPQISESAFSATETKSTSTSSQTSSEPTSFYSTESSTTTRTSYSKEEISITKKYETIIEHTSETTSSDSEAKPTPKPIIKKEVKEGPKPKKEVVIEEEPVVGAEVKPPHFSKVRGAESLRKIYSEY